MPPLIKEYFKLTSEYKKEYGNNTIVLMQVGAFYEVYGLQDKEGIVTGSNIKEFSAECDLATPSKHVKIEKKDVIMLIFIGKLEYCCLSCVYIHICQSNMNIFSQQ